MGSPWLASGARGHEERRVVGLRQAVVELVVLLGPGSAIAWGGRRPWGEVGDHSGGRTLAPAEASRGLGQGWRRTVVTGHGGWLEAKGKSSTKERGTVQSGDGCAVMVEVVEA